jgi:hypothetical protein
VEHFYGDQAVEALIAGQVNGSHPALAEDADNVESVNALRQVGHARRSL